MASALEDLQEADHYINYDAFLSDDFDVNEYVNSAMNDPDSSEAGDAATALAKLSFNVDSLEKQIKDQVTSNNEVLLKQVVGIRELEIVLQTVNESIESLKQSLASLRQRIRSPKESLQSYISQLERISSAADILREVHRFLHLSRRLELQYPLDQSSGADGTDSKVTAERDLSKAALTLSELQQMLVTCDFADIDIIDQMRPDIEKIHTRIFEEADRVLQHGIDTQNQAEIAVGLQVFYNLKYMAQKANEIVNVIIEDVVKNIKHVVNMQSIQKEVKGLMPASNAGPRRVNNEPTFGNQAVWAQTVWGRIEKLVDVFSDSCIKIKVLERVLDIKRDPITHVPFLDEVVKLMEDGSSLVNHFWRVLSVNFEREIREATKASVFLQNTLIGEYPKLLRYLHTFFSRVAIHDGIPLSEYSQSPEYVIMLRTLSNLESGFLARSLNRMYEPINAAFPSYGGASRVPAGRTENLLVVRAISSELEMAKFDNTLIRAVAKNAVKAMNMYNVKCETLVNYDPAIYNISQNKMISTPLSMNFSIVNGLYFMYQSMWKAIEEFPDAIIDVMKDGVEGFRRLMLSIVQQLIEAVKKDLDSVLLGMEKDDFSGSSQRAYDPTDENSGSAYIAELLDRLRFIQLEMFGRFSCGTEPRSWAMQIAQRIVHVFIFQTSLIRPLSEVGKLKLAADMAQLEFAVSQFLSDHGVTLDQIGDGYKALRAIRPLLFLDTSQLSAAHHTANVPAIILIHHLIGRSAPSSLPLPHKHHHMSKMDYMNWVDKHTEKEAIEFALEGVKAGDSKQLEYRLIMDLYGPK
ncbi:hypothetical protein INT43_009029 [Umbelopsis isabellina]|uniref:Conserved oligomeric Golgi complex subunit 5 n=1 Tax=Mortierella isabellina TaxID=91625 RepID=A0A8H7U962_MORIS|nr:hypothetical protein INT43_009029 [Umbelopsis isabellina]